MPSQAGLTLFPKSSILEGGPSGGRSILQRVAFPWEWWQLELDGESCCIPRCEGKAWTVHMLYHTVLPTAVCSFIVAVNAPFLSFSPLKIREHTRLGCVRQSIPRLVGRGECGSDSSLHWGRWACVRESQSLWLNSLSLHRQSFHHCSVEVFGFLEGSLGVQILQRQNRNEDYPVRGCVNWDMGRAKGNTDWWAMCMLPSFKDASKWM